VLYRDGSVVYGGHCCIRRGFCILRGCFIGRGLLYKEGSVL